MERKYLISFLATIKGDKIVVNSLKQIESHTQQAGRAATTSTRRTNDFIKALRRVAVVVPVWFAFRQTMMAVFNTIREGVQHWVSLESAIAKAAAVTSNANVTMAEAMDRVRTMAEDYARTNKGTALEVAEAYYRMGTSGLDFADAIEGTIPATRLANATYGNVATTAKTVSAIYRLMGDSITDAMTPQERMTKISDILARAWANHEVEMGELAQAIANAGAQASTFGLSITELIAVLSVSSDTLIKGGRAGRLFGRTLDELAAKLPKVEEILGETFDPKEQLNWFQIFLKLIARFREMGQATPEIEKRLSDIFNIRARREVRAMINQYENLNATIADLENNSEGMAEALLEIRNNTPEAQIENFRENMAILVKDFITGAVGTNDFVDAMKEINSQMETLGLHAATIGAGISGLFRNIRTMWRTTLDAITSVRTPASEFQARLTRINPMAAIVSQWVQNLGDVGRFGAVDIGREMEEAGTKFIERQSAGLVKLKAERNELSKQAQVEAATEIEISDATMMRLRLTDQLIAAKEMEIQGYNRIAISNQKLLNYVDTVVDRLKDSNLEVNKQQLLTAILERNWTQVINLTRNHVITEKELVNISKMVNDIQAERLGVIEEVTDKLIDQEIELLKLRGQSGTDLILARMAIEDAILGRTDEMRVLDNILDLEREITREKEEQKNVSNETVQLWKVAQQFGTGTASRFARILKGELEVGALGRQDEAIFRSRFTGRYEQLKAAEFFFRGAGINVPIAERPSLTEGDVTAARRRVEERVMTVLPTVPIDMKQTINVSIDSGKISERVVDRIIEQIQEKSSDIRKAIDDSIEQF